MPDLFPFPGLRYQPAALDVDLDAVTAPPYDVIDEEGRARLEAAHPQNAVRLILPRDVEPGDRLPRGRRDLRAVAGGGRLAADAPRLYVYRMAFTDEPGAAPAHAGRDRRPGAVTARRRDGASPTSGRCRRPRATGSTCSGRCGPTSTRYGACRWRRGCRTCWSR